MAGFTEDVQYVPRIGQLVKSDWVIINGGMAPMFLPSLRNLISDEKVEFFLRRGSYYDAIGYDDSTVHIYKVLNANHDLIPNHDLVIVDEVQDLNQAEISIIDLLSKGSDIVVAGDDDQALYGKLRDASEEHIRKIYLRTEYLKRNLPFCMRCPSVVVDATNDIILKAHKQGLLGNRINKTYEPYPRPIDLLYKKIKIVQSTVQTPRSNLFGKYILDCISKISTEEIRESREKGFPTVLIIGTKPYAGQVKIFLEENGYIVETKAGPDEHIDEPFKREDGLEILARDEKSNLGWRILLGIDKPTGWEKYIINGKVNGEDIYTLIETSYRDAILAELKNLKPEEMKELEEIKEQPIDQLTIRMTSFEGAKGMSAQHVFVLGLEDGKFPANRNAIKSIDIRRMIVALTRTRRQCYLLMTKTSFTNGKRRFIQPSIFVEWIQAVRLEVIPISANSFSNQSAKSN